MTVGCLEAVSSNDTPTSTKSNGLLGSFCPQREEGGKWADRHGIWISGPCSYSCHRHGAQNHAYVRPDPPRKALAHDAGRSFFAEEVCARNTTGQSNVRARARRSSDQSKHARDGMAYQQQGARRDSPTAAGPLRGRSLFPRE